VSEILLDTTVCFIDVAKISSGYNILSVRVVVECEGKKKLTGMDRIHRMKKQL